ncbi:hypothetical protein [Microcoleus sp. T2B6]|uniref:hypothetical protein n=1 Tax=Microcoleus sp. T2B6 TaxID=3055424 RepID=UPI002FD29C74
MKLNELTSVATLPWLQVSILSHRKIRNRAWRIGRSTASLLLSAFEGKPGFIKFTMSAIGPHLLTLHPIACLK